jgi:hypothetical protein
MTKVLTRLKIDEVSAVDKSAGKGTKIVLMKRASRPDATPADTLRAFPNPSRSGRSFNELMAEAMAKADADDGDNGGSGSGGGSASDHPIAQLASLLVASGKFSDTAAALHHLLNTRHGSALLHRTRTHKAEKGKPMDTVESLEAERREKLLDIGKGGGAVAVAKIINADQDAHGLSEADYTTILTEHAARLYPNDRPDAAFAKVFADNGTDGVVLRKAHAVVKAAQFDAFSVVPQVISGGEWRDDDDREQALKQLAAIGRRMAPTATPEKQFAVAFEDPKNVALALRVHQRPAATTSFPMPR